MTYSRILSVIHRSNWFVYFCHESMSLERNGKIVTTLRIYIVKFVQQKTHLNIMKISKKKITS